MSAEITKQINNRKNWISFNSFETVPFISSIITTIILIIFGYELLQTVAVAIFVYTIAWYAVALGTEVSIVSAVSLVISAQWLLGPFFAYSFDAVTYKYFMRVDAQRYFSFVIPAVVAFIATMAFFAPKIDIASYQKFIQSRRSISPNAIAIIFALGIISIFIGPFVPNALKFIVFLMIQLQFVAVIYLFVLRKKNRWLGLFIVFGIALGLSTSSGLFHDLILWSALILSFICLDLRLSLFKKLIIMIFGIFLLIQVQAIKADYRESIQTNPEAAGIATFVTSIVSATFGEASDGGASNWGLLNARLNQGWIIAAVIATVPQYVPHENGLTVFNAIKDSFLPRFISAKRVVSVSQAFKKYTGLTVSRNTSFGISIVGEAWVNFGYYGIVFMAFLGMFYAVVLRICVYLSRIWPTFILWTPLLFLQAVKAETEFVVVLNHQIKAFIFIILVYFCFDKLLKIRL